jgi:Na+-transporting methylmalonyl-CoA/oxaloacetate decarboxylase gamma subunit
MNLMTDISMTIGSVLELGGLLIVIGMGIVWTVGYIQAAIKEWKEARR